MFKGLGDISSLLQNAHKIPAQIEEINRELKSKQVTGSAGGGMVTVQMDGTGDVKSVNIEPELFEQGDRELIEDLIPAAVNEATGKAKQLYAESMQGLAGGMNLPGMDDLLAKFGGGAS